MHWTIFLGTALTGQAFMICVAFMSWPQARTQSKYLPAGFLLLPLGLAVIATYQVLTVPATTSLQSNSLVFAAISWIAATGVSWVTYFFRGRKQQTESL